MKIIQRDEDASELKEMLIDFLFVKQHEPFTGFNVLSDYEFEVYVGKQPILVEIWDSGFIFSIHFNENIKKISEEFSESIESVYRSMNFTRVEYSYSMDENYHVYYSVSTVVLPEYDDLECILYDLYDALRFYEKLISDWWGIRS